MGARPRSVAFSADGSRAFVPAENDFTLAVIDTTTLSVEKVIPLGEAMRAMGVVLSPDGRQIYVSTGRSRMVVILDTKSLEVIGSIDAGLRPWGLDVHPSGDRIYTANGPSNDVSVIDVATQAVVATIPSGGSPWGVTVVETAGQ